MAIIRLLLAAMLGYLVGSFPTGVLVTRLLNKPDLRSTGSGHTGGLNVSRQAGLAWGAFTALVDAGKGVLAAWLAVRLTGTSWALPAAGVGAVVGHCWSAYGGRTRFGFAGGMGLSTLSGLFLWQQPLVLPIAVTLWALCYLVIRNRPRSVMLMTALMAPVFWLLRSVGYVSLEAAVLGIGGVGVIFIRNLTQLPAYDQRATAEYQ